MKGSGLEASVSVDVELGNPGLARAIAEALSADADDPRFPLSIEASGGRVTIRSARPLDPGDAEAFVYSALSLLRAAYFSVVSVEP
ncbi:MAG: hypothetical protein ACP5NG_01390 [Conexivisphaera sp.]